MKRYAVVGLSVAVVLLVAGALLAIRRYHSTPLSFTDLSLKHIDPPASWADPDCERLRRAVRAAGGNSGLKIATDMGRLTADEVAVYRVVLHQWNSGARTLNVANKTFPLDEVFPDSSCECLRGLDIQNLASASHSFHYLNREVFPDRGIRFVNDKQFTAIQINDAHHRMAAGKSWEKAVEDAFGSGLFSMSDIAFDKEHREALVSYGFVCGSLCGSGGTWLLEKVDGVWKTTNHVCGGWVS